MKRPARSRQEIIDRAKAGFEADLFRHDYASIHYDQHQLTALLDLCPLISQKRYLDLGTGNGYVAFALARLSSRISVTGIDIAHRAVVANKERARAKLMGHLDFISYGGTLLPFKQSSFFGAISRYAFHHFPDPDLSAAELFRSLEPGGFCIIADPVPESNDRIDFINRFMALKDDGHVAFRSSFELAAIFEKVGFQPEAHFSTSITFPRELTDDYLRLIADTPDSIRQAYRLRLDRGHVYLTVGVSNICFRRK